MRKSLCSLLTVIGLAFILQSNVMATPISTYEEVFDTNLRVKEGQRAIYYFDLTGIGGNSFVKDGGTRVSDKFLPTIDETNFNPLDLDVVSAVLSFEIGGMDGGNFAPRERIKIRVAGENGTGETLMNETVFLGIDTFSFDLTGDWLDWLDDGKLKTVAIAVERGGFNNDFKMRSASLYVEAAQIPNPGTLLLFAPALFGLMLVGRKK